MEDCWECVHTQDDSVYHTIVPRSKRTSVPNAAVSFPWKFAHQDITANKALSGRQQYRESRESPPPVRGCHPLLALGSSRSRVSDASDTTNDAPVSITVYLEPRRELKEPTTAQPALSELHQNLQWQKPLQEKEGTQK